MEIKTLEIAGLMSALRALRLPFGKEPRSEADFKWNKVDARERMLVESECRMGIDRWDVQLMSALVRRGDEHAKAVRGIIVWAEITAPIYWWCEAETYRAGHERLSSESTMHGVAKGLVGDKLVVVKSELPMGTPLKKVDFFSYQCLHRIVLQRSGHRLPEWRGFIDWVRTLPLADELIFACEIPSGGA